MHEKLENWPKEWTRVPGAFENLQDIIYEKKYFSNGGVARISFCYEVKPGFMAWRSSTFLEWRDCLIDANRDPSIGVVVVTSASPNSFMAGGDMYDESSGGSEAEFEKQNALLIQGSIRRCRKPIIAAVKGYCIAVGNHLAYFTDFTIAADNAIFGQNGPRIASPADGYIVAYLTRVIGAKKAREMWMLCRRYTAQEAYEMGLVNKVVALDKIDEEADKWCQEILDMHPACIEILKASFDADIDYMRASLTQFQNLMYPDHFHNPQTIEAQRAFFEKRTPDYGKHRGRPEGWS
jgi:1,4-dihydroxy-2-naphthoyl-CoA synthase